MRDAIGVDDSHTFAAQQEKQHQKDESKQGVQIWIHAVEPEQFGIDSKDLAP